MFHYITGTYITTEIGVCGFSVVIQTIILSIYHAQWIGPVLRCLMAVEKHLGGIGISHVRQSGEPECIQTIHDQEHDQESTRPEMKNHKRRSTLREKRGSKAENSNDVTFESVKQTSQRIARMCDKFCFVLFLVFHVLFIVTVVAILLGAGD